ncbi:tetratricopeptide repeat protein [Luteibacter pinisoli]|uniref:Tetratricopeptide repeat protein n=1 Tax=Luteibacter pinisoli TaxID=2589080 RepID=A0A4Y5Z0J3_9GAMM|nr:tetratricopeptide repeat protein [Luteibacter pinisoli]QDE38792.1 tetratricopeptide repeat protein [Luteibacter pinisoli]
MAYKPGLHGPFVFDDFGNLPALGTGGPVHDLASALRYVTSGKADPTGRPLATASFLIDAKDWPASPYPFKRTNLIIHLINGGLLAWFLARLGVALALPDGRARLAAIIASALWMLSPLLVSTVLYVVQREAMLPATFMLLAGLTWLHARSRFALSPAHATVWLFVGTGGCTLLALLCKANGAVIPLLILVCEWMLPAPDDSRFRRRVVAMCAPPSIALLAGLAWLAVSSSGHGTLVVRGWTIGQRLMTEPTILVRYLAQLGLLVPTDTSVLHDGERAATGLISPWYTVAAITGCLALVGSALLLRHRLPALALAILFFFAGHVMESTSIPLELYFDHRNYLPALLLFWPLGLAITRIGRPLYVTGSAVAVVAISAALTQHNATLWGDVYRQSLVWAAANPQSPRSQAYAAQVAEANGQRAVASQIMSAATRRFRAEPQVALVNIDVQCLNGGLTAEGLAYAKDALATTTTDPGGMLLNWFESAIPAAHSERCTRLTPAVLSSMVDIAMANPAISGVAGRRQDLNHVRGQLALADGDVKGAARWFDEALADQPSPAAALSQAAALGAAGRPDLGVAHLDFFAKLPKLPAPRWQDGMAWVHAGVLDRQGYWPSELSHLRQALEAAARAASPQGELR